MQKLMITIVAMMLIGGLEGLALSRGIDGVGLAASVALIAGLGGYQIGKRRS